MTETYELYICTPSGERRQQCVACAAADVESLARARLHAHAAVAVEVWKNGEQLFTVGGEAARAAASGG